MMARPYIEETVDLDLSKVTASEMMSEVERLMKENPESEVFLDGDRRAIVLRRLR